MASQSYYYEKPKIRKIPNFSISFFEVIEFQHQNDYMKDYLAFREKFGLAQHLKYIKETENQHQREMLRLNSGYDGTLSCFIKLINSFNMKFKQSLEDQQYSIRKEQYAEQLKKLIYEKQMAKVREVSRLLLKKRHLLTQMQEQFSQKIDLLREQVKIAKNQTQMLSDQLKEQIEFEKFSRKDQIEVNSKHIENLIRIQYKCKYNDDKIQYFNLRDLISQLGLQQHYNKNGDFMHLYNVKKLLQGQTYKFFMLQMYCILDHPLRTEKRQLFRNFIKKHCSFLSKSDYVQYELIEDEELIDFRTSDLSSINYILYKKRLVDKRMDFKVFLVNNEANMVNFKVTL
ncbi:UNKNOWN [Stylonychia lemnae]|uniref:Uncharacterized protein n=1 Tax=Stylonychia lemnae TaxID=5949 RepID=A0A078BCB6_STYLE|nr:UNKNOWN [Stylonychia lemnae]|eukprot:CDW91841.1 UNKNOWN [Stylonychia lemnae]